jgi:hypothetical protein
MVIQIKVKNPTRIHGIFYETEFASNATTLEELIRELVMFNVAEYNAKRVKNALFLVSDETAEALAVSGKIAFGEVLNSRKVDVKTMQDEAIFAFQNGRFKVIDETTKREYFDLAETLDFHDDTVLVFLKLTLLSGRWF